MEQRPREANSYSLSQEILQCVASEESLAWS